jgi:site-specific DNA-cytosine methylase
MRYIAHIPLAGGFALGNMNITGKPPVAITSYTPFEANDLLFRRYLKKKGYDVPYFLLDKITEKERKDLSHLIKNIDFATAIPPCSGLSQAAQRKAGSRGSAPPNDWMYESANFILGDVKPTVYSFENAPTLYTGAGDDVRYRLSEIAKQYGYSITFYKTNTLKHGIPQFRPRTFGIFYKGDYAPILNYYDREAPHIADYLKEIPKDAKHQDDYVHNEWDITKFEIYKFLKMKHGENWRKAMHDFRPHLTTYDYLLRKDWLKEFLEWQKKLPEEERSEIVTKNVEHILKKKAQGKGARINYRVLGIDKEYMYAVIGEVMGKQVHPTEDRIMNIREHMHMMGLPHDYELEGPREYVKISQNVPTKTAADITYEIIAIINNRRQLNSNSILMQDNSKIKPISNNPLF